MSMSSLTLMQILVLAVLIVVSSVMTVAVRRYVVARNILDVPNERSSHVQATPRGGGVAICIGAFGSLVLGAGLDWMPYRLMIALVGGGVMVAGIGFLDDRVGVRPSVRLTVHFLAAFFALWWLDGYPNANLGMISLRLGFSGSLLAAVGIVWATNFFNFMDGIDGIACIEAISVGVAGALLIGPNLPGLKFASLVLAASCAGFLFWNWPPAKIFMGDVGSGSLGFLFAILAIASENTGGPPVMVWAIVQGVFVFDATVTLVRRARRKDTLSVAHREHGYQRAVRSGFSHRAVALGVLTLNLMLVLLAWLSRRIPSVLFPIAVVALLLLAAVYLWIERRLPMTART
jgi:Fuc2NAc and GlcNAc transferase